MRHAARRAGGRFRCVGDHGHLTARRIESRINQHIASARLDPVCVDDTQRLFVAQNPRPGDELARATHRERTVEDGARTQVLPVLS